MPWTSADRPIDLNCPRCQSTDAMHFRSLRSSAVYLCRECEHQWEVEGTAAAPETREASSDIKV